MEEELEQTTLDSIEETTTNGNEYDGYDIYSDYEDLLTTGYENEQEVIDIASSVDDDIAFGVGILAGGLFITTLLVVLAISLVAIIANWKIFTKAGKPGWASIIPIYSTWVSYEIVNMPGWLALAALVPVIGSIAAVIFLIMQRIRLSKAFGKPTEFSIGLILLPIVFLPILAFGKSQYLGKEAAGNELFK